MKITFYPQSCVPITANTLIERPLGGTETGIIRIGEELAKLGHEVTIFTSEKTPPESNPKYIPFSQASNISEQDVFISIREWFPLMNKIPSKLKYYWTGDAANQIHNVGIGDKRVVNSIDLILTVSKWQTNQLSKSSGFPIEKTFVLGNGVHLPYFTQNIEKDPYKLIYSATPFRGLIYLPVIFENILKHEPKATLDIYSGIEVYDNPSSQKQNELVKMQFKSVFEKLQSNPSVNVYGNVKQKDLAKAFQKASIHCYPNNFEETSCITAMEAQAGGAVNVTSTLGALPETIDNSGVFINNKVGSDEFLQNFIKACLFLLKNPEKRSELQQRGKEIVLKKNNWASVTKKLESKIKNDLLNLNKT